MGMERISTGSDLLNTFLDGGYETDVVTTIYGPAGSGKTTFCLLALAKMISSGRKVIFIDTEGGFSITRLQQLFPEFKSHVDNILFLKPTTFDEQKKAFERLREIVDEQIGLIIIDSASMLYRLERREEIVQSNRELGLQIAILCEIARKKNIPTILTNQVYSSFDDRERVNIVGGDILKYGSKCLIELESGHRGVRVATLRKHRSIPEGKCISFRIVNEGISTVSTPTALSEPKSPNPTEQTIERKPSEPDSTSYFRHAEDVLKRKE